MESPRKSSENLFEPESLLRVRSKNQELQDLIENLSSKLSTLYNHNEGEFLASYRVHSAEILTELKELKEKIKRAEEALNHDEEVSNLEKEVSWFREETERLTLQSEHMNNDLDLMSTRIDSLQDQKKYLSEQLKSILKKSRVYEAEIESHNENDMKSQTSLESNENPGLPAIKVSEFCYNCSVSNEIINQFSRIHGHKIIKIHHMND